MPDTAESELIISSPVTVNGTEFRVTRKGNHVVNMEALLTEQQHDTLLHHFDDKQRKWTNACYTYLFQSELAAFEQKCIDHPHYKTEYAGIDALTQTLRRWSEAYVDFEEMINNPPATPDPLGTLITQLNSLDSYITNNHMPAQLAYNLRDFMAKAIALRNKPPTPKEIKQFFCIQEENPELSYLGQFLRDQMTLLTEASRDKVYEIIYKKGKFRNRFSQLFVMHPLLKKLSDASYNIEKKGHSSYGERYLSRNPTPASMIAAMRGVSEDASKDAPLWTTLMDRLDRPDSLLDIDRILRKVTLDDSIKAHEGPKPGMKHHGAVFLASIPELVILSPLRFTFALIGGIVHLFMMPFTPEKNKKKWTSRFAAFDNALSRWFRYFSPVIQVKKWRNNQYQKIDKNLHDAIEPISYYDQLLNMISAVNIAEYFSSALARMANSITSEWSNAKSTFRTLFTFTEEGKKNKRNKSIDKITNKITEDWKKRFNAVVQNKKQERNSSESNEKQYEQGTRERIQHIDPNEISSFLDFFDDLGVGLSDVVIEPMFRKSPGAATFFFIIANASFGALTAPGLFGSASYLFTTPASKIALAFMGKHTSTLHHANMMNDLFAAFLQWKLSFFPVEAMLEVHHDKDLLATLLHDSEQITLGAAAMVALGYAWQFVPHIPDSVSVSGSDIGVNGDAVIPNYYASAANIFSHESIEVSEMGAPPCTALEYGFLGVKSVFLVHSLLEGSSLKDKHDPIKQIFAPVTVKKNKNTEYTYPIMYRIFDHMKTATHHRSLADVIEEKGEVAFKANTLRPAVLKACTEFNLAMSQAQINTVVNYFYQTIIENQPLVEKSLSEGKALDDTTHGMKRVHPNSLVAKRQKLLAAIRSVKLLELMEKPFDSVDDARDYYDHLYECIKDYNHAQRTLGNWDKQLDKERFLHAFYNKYCYKGTSNLLLLVSIFPFYPLKLLWRGFLSLSNSPATQYDIKKSFAKERVIGMQLSACIGRMSHVLLLSYTYGFRAFLMAPLFPFIVLLAIPNIPIWIAKKRGYTVNYANLPSFIEKPFNKWIDFTLWIAPYNHVGDGLRSTRNFIGRRLLNVAQVLTLPMMLFMSKSRTELLTWMRTQNITGQHGKAASIADMNHGHLASSADKLMLQLTNDTSSNDSDTWLPGDPRQHAKRSLTSFKQTRKDEKSDLERYAHGMQTLEDRLAAIEAEQDNPHKNNPRFKAIKTQVTSYKDAMNKPTDETTLAAGLRTLLYKRDELDVLEGKSAVSSLFIPLMNKNKASVNITKSATNDSDLGNNW